MKFKWALAIFLVSLSFSAFTQDKGPLPTEKIMKKAYRIAGKHPQQSYGKCTGQDKTTGRVANRENDESLTGKLLKIS